MNFIRNSIKSESDERVAEESQTRHQLRQQFGDSKTDIHFDDNELILPNNDLIDENVFDLEENNKISDDSNEDNNYGINGLDVYIGVRVVEGKERLFCKWSECRFESMQKSCISRHVLNRHLNPKQANPFEQIDSYDESKYWDKIMNSNKDWLQRSHSKGPQPSALPAPPVLTPFVMEPPAHSSAQMFIDDKQWLERMSSIASLQSTISSQNNCKSVEINNKLNDSFEGFEERDVMLKNHLNISNNEENILLSCKGLASMSKVRNYYESQIIKGEKLFLCKFSTNCSFKTKKSQKIAQHINLTHIGVEFKCNKPNCYKVFKNPNTYREHQKNHICGFGIFGYGSKGVIGVCRNESLNQYRERVIIDSKKFYRCKWDSGNGMQCNAITRYHMAMKRHIHNHVCPYRVNLKLKQNQDVINEIKSETWNLDLGLGSIASTSQTSTSQTNNTNINKKTTYQCRRTKCRASFTNNADLLKHENLLCKYIVNYNNLINNNNNNNNNNKTVGSLPMKAPEKQRPIISIEELTPNRVKPNEQIVRKATVPQLNSNKLQNNWNPDSADIKRMANVDKYFNTKVMNGVVYHLCIYSDCKFTSKLLHKTIDHIQTQHFGLETQLNSNSEPNIRTNSVQNSGKRVHSITESPETNGSKENSNKKLKSVEIIVNNTDDVVIEKTVGPTTAGTRHQFVKQTIAGETNYFCSHKDCEFYTKYLTEMKAHLNEFHSQQFGCDIDDCGKQFRTLFALNQHKVNHICGFNIKGRKATGVCDLENIRKYRHEIIVGQRLIYGCKWFGCYENFDNRNIALSHIHNRHVCPNRLAPIGPQTSTISTVVDKNRNKSNSNQSFKTNENTIEIIEL